MQRCAVILFAHGSRDPMWSAPVRAIANRMQQMSPALPVACAYLEFMAPDLAQASDTLITAGANHLTVVPLFLGVGHHTRQDLPRMVTMLRLQYPQAEFDLRPAVGEDPRVVALLAEIACGQIAAGRPPAGRGLGT